MAGWEAHAQGAPDPFFPDGRSEPFNVVDAIAAGQDFVTTPAELRSSLAEYEARYGPLVDPADARECDGYPALAEPVIDIPSAVTPAEAARLTQLARGRTVLEIGALLGHSTVVLAREAIRVVSVDPHEGYPAHDPRPTLGPFLENLERYGARDKVTVCIGTDADVLPYLRRREFGLAFIDTTGEYDVTLAAMRRCVPLLRNFAALAVHDCGHPEWPGALEAAQDFAREWCHPFELVDRMAVFTGMWSSHAPEEEM